MYVYVCFDVEDLVHPPSDDAALAVAEMLAKDGITASMCIVGEKARLWERRGRQDVIAAMARHDVGLHTERHSKHPVVAEYLADKGWEDGVAEAVRQEEPGAKDLTRIFGRPPTEWGTPGSSWAPQIPAATRQLGIPANIYSDAHAGGSGACWYAGQLCYADLSFFPGGEDAYCDDAAFEAALPTFLQQVGAIRDSGNACLGVFAAHPTRLRYTAFWDAVNFRHGEQTAEEDYRFVSPRSDEAYATGLRNLRRMVNALRDLPGAEIVGVGDLNQRFAPENGAIAMADLFRMAKGIAETGEIPTEDPASSPAQLLDALTRAILARIDRFVIPDELPLRTVLGPVKEPPPLTKPLKIYPEFELPRLRYLARYIETNAHLPASLRLNATPVGPGPLLRAMAKGLIAVASGIEPEEAVLQPGAEEPAVAASLAEHIYRTLPGWPPHPADLKLDQIALHARLQTWSLKPAALKG